MTLQLHTVSFLVILLAFLAMIVHGMSMNMTDYDFDKSNTKDDLRVFKESTKNDAVYIPNKKTKTYLECITILKRNKYVIDHSLESFCYRVRNSLTLQIIHVLSVQKRFANSHFDKVFQFKNYLALKALESFVAQGIEIEDWILDTLSMVESVEALQVVKYIGVNGASYPDPEPINRKKFENIPGIKSKYALGCVNAFHFKVHRLVTQDFADSVSDDVDILKACQQVKSEETVRNIINYLNRDGIRPVDNDIMNALLEGHEPSLEIYNSFDESKLDFNSQCIRSFLINGYPISNTVKSFCPEVTTATSLDAVRLLTSTRRYLEKEALYSTLDFDKDNKYALEALHIWTTTKTAPKHKKRWIEVPGWVVKACSKVDSDTAVQAIKLIQPSTYYDPEVFEIFAKINSNYALDCVNAFNERKSFDINREYNKGYLELCTQVKSEQVVTKIKEWLSTTEYILSEAKMRKIMNKKSVHFSEKNETKYFKVWDDTE